MANKVLVERTIHDGEVLIKELKKKVTVKDAVWLYDDDDNMWKLLITSPSVKKEGPKYLYELIGRILRKKNSPLLFSFIQALDTDDSLIKMLRAANKVRYKSFGSAKDDTYIYILDGHEFEGLKHAS